MDRSWRSFRAQDIIQAGQRPGCTQWSVLLAAAPLGLQKGKKQVQSIDAARQHGHTLTGRDV